VCHTYREPSGSGATDGTTGLADRVEPVPNQIPTRRSISSRDADLSSTMSGTCGHTAAQMSVIAQSEWSCLFDRLADLDCRPLGVRHRMAAVKRHVTTRAAPRTQERGGNRTCICGMVCRRPNRWTIPAAVVESTPRGP
jgi:hypothetical protein